MRLLAVSIFLTAMAVPAVAQEIDPQAMMEQLIRRQEIESRQQFQDRQNERAFQQYERDYDRRSCRRAGVRGPDIEQCARDMADRRRGYYFDPPRGGGSSSSGTTCINGGGVIICD